MKVLELGAGNGALWSQNIDKVPTGVTVVLSDISERMLADAVDKVITEVNPDVIIHCAAWTAVDMAEDDDKVAAVRKVNVGGTQNIANVAKKLDVPMVYLSTDYVFDGQGTKPWEPDFKGYKPLNVYGETKLGGEKAVSDTLDKYFIVRIAWVFGINGHNLIKTMLKVGANHDEVKVVDDQIGTPTYTFDLARLLVDMIETDKYGYYHATNSELPVAEGDHDANGTKTGYISWYDFTKEIYRQAGYDTKVTPVTTAEYGLSKAVRPFNSRLDKSKLVDNGFKPLPLWTDAVHRYLEILKKQGFFDELNK
nr:dTDP-4-dehydrorhamnose reductase [Lactobacillus helveticus]